RSTARAPVAGTRVPALVERCRMEIRAAWDWDPLPGRESRPSLSAARAVRTADRNHVPRCRDATPVPRSAEVTLLGEMDLQHRPLPGRESRPSLSGRRGVAGGGRQGAAVAGTRVPALVERPSSTRGNPQPRRAPVAGTRVPALVERRRLATPPPSGPPR